MSLTDICQATVLVALELWLGWESNLYTPQSEGNSYEKGFGQLQLEAQFWGAKVGEGISFNREKRIPSVISEFRPTPDFLKGLAAPPL